MKVNTVFKQEITTHLPALGIACSLGVGKKAVMRVLFETEGGISQKTMQETILPSGKHVPVGRIPVELPPLSQEFVSFNSRNNALLKMVLDEIGNVINEVKARYGAHRIGVVMGTSTSGMAEGERAFIHKSQTRSWPSDYAYDQQEIASPSNFTALYCGLEGPAYTLSTACSSGSKALCSAQRLLQAGICDAVITGGVDTLCDLTLNGFDSLELLSETVCTPFSQNRQGITIGEGAAIFLMTREALTSCPEGILFAGGGESSDAHHINSPEPDGQGAERAIRQALDMAGLGTEDIAYINLHGTATQLNDSMESICVNRVFGDATPCSSTKALTGHTLGAAGAIGAAFLWLSLSQEKEKTIPLPPHVWDGQWDPLLPKIRFANAGERVSSMGEKFALMSNSFAFGGSNVSVILSKGKRENNDDKLK